MKNPMFPFPVITPKNMRDDGANAHDTINHIKLAEENLRKEMLLKASFEPQVFYLLEFENYTYDYQMWICK